jgi:hypothetical protein
MACTKIKTKKYQTRKGPPYHAKDCKGQTKKGNDKKLYISTPDKKGIYKWILVNTNKTHINHTRKVKTGNYKSYKILDNGSEPFIANVYPTNVEVYKQKYTLINNNIEKYIVDKKIINIPYTDIFIGDNTLKDPSYAPKGMWPGNSLLIKIKNDNYIHVGREIYSFETIDKENIKEYYSPVGNSVVPYPYAIGENYTYLMLDRVAIPNKLFDFKKDIYGQFYGWITKDDSQKGEIVKSKKKLKIKLIHKSM